MPSDRRSKLLKLFCIVEPGEVPIGWESRSIFCFLLVGSVFLALSGVYFQMRLAKLSAYLCFTLSVTGFLITILPIMLEYNRRRKCRFSNRHNVASTIEVTPVFAEKSVYVDIETDFLESSRYAENQQHWIKPIYITSSQMSSDNIESDQQWMKPVSMDEPVYETGPDPYEADDFEEQESDYSSSETRTIYYNSSSEDDDFNRITSEESYINAVDGSYFGSIQDYEWKIEENLSKNGRLVEQERVTSSTKDLRETLQQMSEKQDHLMVSSFLQDEIEQNSNYVEYDCINPNVLEEGDNVELYLPENQDNHVNNLYPSKPHDKHQSKDRNSMLIQCVDKEYVAINIEDSQLVLEICDNLNPSKQIPCQNANKTGHFFATQRQLTKKTLDFEDGFANSNIELSSKSENAGRKKWKWSERKDDVLRIKKRPLLDANGNPISQYAFVQELTELLRNGLKQVPDDTGKKCI